MEHAHLPLAKYAKALVISFCLIPFLVIRTNAQTLDVSVGVTQTPIGVGAIEQLSVEATLTIPKFSTISASTISCTINGTSASGFPIQNPSWGPGLSTPFAYSKQFTVTESATGTYLVKCAISGSYSGSESGSFANDNSASFTVSSCSGDSDYSEAEPDDQGNGFVETTWTLSATMSPAANTPSGGWPTGTGRGTTGDLDQTSNPDLSLDCQDDTNDNEAEHYPEIEDAGQILNGDGSLTFNWTITDYEYEWDACDPDDCTTTYADGVENVTDDEDYDGPVSGVSSLTLFCGKDG
jgi:hypothetical protein